VIINNSLSTAYSGANTVSVPLKAGRLIRTTLYKKCSGLGAFQYLQYIIIITEFLNI